MLMWRRLERNCQPGAVGRLCRCFCKALEHAGGRFTYIGFVIGPSPRSSLQAGRRAFKSTSSSPCGATRSRKPWVVSAMLSLFSKRRSDSVRTSGDPPGLGALLLERDNQTAKAGTQCVDRAMAALGRCCSGDGNGRFASRYSRRSG
jgi:hypothetical protein